MVGTLVRRCRCATSWRDLDLTFDLAVGDKTPELILRGWTKPQALLNCHVILN